MNVSEFIYGLLYLFDLILNVEFLLQGVVLCQFIICWEGGMVRIFGVWLCESKVLILDDIVIVGLEYMLLENWKQLWMKLLFDWLNSLMLKKFSVSCNLVIDIDLVFLW